MIAEQCPDGGTCHHSCANGKCFRVSFCAPLSNVYPDDKWPEELLPKGENLISVPNRKPD